MDRRKFLTIAGITVAVCPFLPGLISPKRLTFAQVIEYTLAEPEREKEFIDQWDKDLDAAVDLVFRDENNSEYDRTLQLLQAHIDSGKEPMRNRQHFARVLDLVYMHWHKGTLT